MAGDDPRGRRIYRRPIPWRFPGRCFLRLGRRLYIDWLSNQRAMFHYREACGHSTPWPAKEEQNIATATGAPWAKHHGVRADISSYTGRIFN
jgi:hypothetical protein